MTRSTTNFTASNFDLELLRDVFDQVYRAMTHARQNKHEVAHDNYICRETILKVVEQAIEKAERQALDAYRTQIRKENGPSDSLYTLKT